MPVCINCDGTDFECLDGKFFCADCDTQSQNFVDEQAPEVSLPGEASFTTRRLKKRMTKSSTAEKGLPWRSVEGFQLIIKAHVKALIELGFTSSLDEVMQQIWFKFVHKSGMAIIDQNEGTFKAENIKFRDFFLEQFKDDIVPNRNACKEVKLRLSRNAKKKSSSTELESEEEWFSVDTDHEDVYDEGSQSDSCGSIKTTSKRKKTATWRSINVMTNPKIIAFCYLALRWCDEPVTIGDLFHWAEDGRLPYYASKECFLPHMKLSDSDHNTFDQGKTLDYEKIFTTCVHLVKYLGIPDLPKVNAMELTCRYLYQLNLPLSLSAYAFDLLEQFDKNSTSCSTRRVIIKSMELRCAAVILILLKHMFKLNDQEEWSITDNNDTCQTEHENQEMCQKFTWQNWVQQHLLHQTKKIKKNYTLFDDKGLHDVGNVHACMENYLSVVIKGTDVKSERKYSTNIQERSQTRSAAFTRLVEKQGSADVKTKISEELENPKYLYDLLGRFEDSQLDFTNVCRAHLSNLRSAQDTYMRYESRDVGDFHSSYKFILKIMSCLIHASVSNIHECVWLVEKFTIVKMNEILI